MGTSTIQEEQRSPIAPPRQPGPTLQLSPTPAPTYQPAPAPTYQPTSAPSYQTSAPYSPAAAPTYQPRPPQPLQQPLQQSPQQLPLQRAPLQRADSRTTLPVSPAPRPPPPNYQPQFQPGGAVNTAQFQQRPLPPHPPQRVPLAQPQPQPQFRQPLSQQPLQQQRPSGPQSFAPQRAPIPAPKGQPLGNPQYTPQQIIRQPQPLVGPGIQPAPRPVLEHQGSLQQQRPTVLPTQLSRQSSQGSINGSELPTTPTSQKTFNLDNFGNITERPSTDRSYATPIKKIDDSPVRGPPLGNIQEVKIPHPIAKSFISGSKESVRSDGSNESTKNMTFQAERPDSRLAGSRMTDSVIGSMALTLPKSPAVHSAMKRDDDDDVVMQQQITNNIINSQTYTNTPVKTPIMTDRSPSLNQSDSSPDVKKSPSPDQRPDSRQFARPSSAISNETKTPEPPYARPQQNYSPINRPAQPNLIQQSPQPPQPTQPKPQPVIQTQPQVQPQPHPQLHQPQNGMINCERPSSRAGAKPTDFQTPIPQNMSKQSTPRKVTSATPRARVRDGDNDSGVDEFTQGHEVNGSPGSPTKKTVSKIPARQPNGTAGKTLPLSRSPSKSAAAPKTPDSTTSNTSIEKKKVPMNKVQVGNAPSPNIKAIKSKIGSLENATHKPGGGNIKIENRKLDFKAAPKIAAKNDAYTPSGGEKKISQQKLQWNAKSKIGSLENASYKPGGGDKKIESVKLDFKDKAKPKVASTVNIHHKAGGGAIKIETQKLEIKAQSKVGSLDNVKHKAGGGEVKIFDDKEYMKQISAGSGHSGQESPAPPAEQNQPKNDENLNRQS